MLSNSLVKSHLDYIEKRIRKPLEGRGSQRSIGLVRIVGTHGTEIGSVVNLVKEGEFSGGANNLQGTFHLTPNLKFSGWRETEFSGDISDIVDKVRIRNPLDISQEYAEAYTPRDDEERGGEADELSKHGVVIAFSGRVLDLVRLVDLDEVRQEPEVVLEVAPPLESVQAIYPVDELAHSALVGALEDLR